MLVPFEGLFSPLHWIIIAVVALIVLGPEELPTVARHAARFVRDLQELRRHLTAELRDAVADFDHSHDVSSIGIDGEEEPI